MRVEYEGVEWGAIQMTEAGECSCQGRTKRYAAGDWVLISSIPAGAMKIVLSAADFFGARVKVGKPVEAAFEKAMTSMGP